MPHPRLPDISQRYVPSTRCRTTFHISLRRAQLVPLVPLLLAAVPRFAQVVQLVLLVSGSTEDDAVRDPS
jgi:hypothetical protein